MQRNESSGPRKRIHLNEDNQSRNRQNNPNSRRRPYILNQRLAQEMKDQGKIYEHWIGDKKIYFPHEHLHGPQKKFLSSMFDCLNKSENLLIESPTGTGKTLNLLVSTLAWADSFYQNEEGSSVFDNQTKIIYTSRAHSQLSQVSQELQRTPYRPKMLVFGSREKLCINQQLEKQFSGEQNGYDNWAQKCNIAVNIQQRYSKNQPQLDQQIQKNKKTVEKLKSKTYLNSLQREQLKAAEQFLSDINLRCTHYHDYSQGYDASFWKYIGREVLNNEKLKQMARQFKPHSICPYYYPKRVKNRGTLYLMPYNYILDSKILEYSSGFLSNSIVIFDEGHNAPKTACDGYSITLTDTLIQMTKKNVTQTLKYEDYDNQQLQVENLIKSAQNQPQQFQQSEDNEEMEGLIREIRRKNKEKQRIARQNQQDQPPGLKNHINILLPILVKIEKNFKSFFEYERIQDLKKTGEYKHSSNEQSYQRRSFYWQTIRSIHTFEREEIINWMEEILFSQKSNEFDYKSLKEKLQIIKTSEKFILDYFMQQGRRFFKLMSFSSFCDRLYKILYDAEYMDKFFLQIKQLRKYQTRLNNNIYKGQVQIRCLAPQFAFNSLEKLNPRSIIITSGTLSPMDIFGSQTGLSKLKKQQVDPVITQKNILVRKITKNLNGNALKIDSTFYIGKNGLQIQNLTSLFNLLIKTLENIPHGVLVIVSSFSCLKNIQKFYHHQNSAQIRHRLQYVKPHVYFEPKKNLQQKMDLFKQNSVQGKGALLFCVCRAKLSEGIDFKDRLCRSVIFLGIPYVDKGDSFVVSKGKYLRKKKYPYASKWKFIEASKAINQGLGRTVRHANDFGSILLFDDRYHNTNTHSIPVVQNISQWIKKNWKVSDDPHQLQKQLSQFYSKCQIEFPLKNEDQNQTQNGRLNLRQYYAQKL